jgi:hypothetical protein
MIRLRLAALAAMLALSACASANVFPSQTGRSWNDVDSNGVPLSRGAAECKTQAKLDAKMVTGVSQQAEVAGDLYEQCMRRRGYGPS